MAENKKIIRLDAFIETENVNTLCDDCGNELEHRFIYHENGELAILVNPCQACIESEVESVIEDKICERNRRICGDE